MDHSSNHVFITDHGVTSAGERGITIQFHMFNVWRKCPNRVNNSVPDDPLLAVYKRC